MPDIPTHPDIPAWVANIQPVPPNTPIPAATDVLVLDWGRNDEPFDWLHPGAVARTVSRHGTNGDGEVLVVADTAGDGRRKVALLNPEVTRDDRIVIVKMKGHEVAEGRVARAMRAPENDPWGGRRVRVMLDGVDWWAHEWVLAKVDVDPAAPEEAPVEQVNRFIDLDSVPYQVLPDWLRRIPVTPPRDLAEGERVVILDWGTGDAPRENMGPGVLATVEGTTVRDGRVRVRADVGGLAFRTVTRLNPALRAGEKVLVVRAESVHAARGLIATVERDFAAGTAEVKVRFDAPVAHDDGRVSETWFASQWVRIDATEPEVQVEAPAVTKVYRDTLTTGAGVAGDAMVRVIEAGKPEFVGRLGTVNTLLREYNDNEGAAKALVVIVRNNYAYNPDPGPGPYEIVDREAERRATPRTGVRYVLRGDTRNIGNTSVRDTVRVLTGVNLGRLMNAKDAYDSDRHAKVVVTVSGNPGIRPQYEDPGEATEYEIVDVLPDPVPEVTHWTDLVDPTLPENVPPSAPVLVLDNGLGTGDRAPEGLRQGDVADVVATDVGSRLGRVRVKNRATGGIGWRKVALLNPEVAPGARVICVSAHYVPDATGKIATVEATLDGRVDLRFDKEITNADGIKDHEWRADGWVIARPETDPQKPVVTPAEERTVTWAQIDRAIDGTYARDRADVLEGKARLRYGLIVKRVPNPDGRGGHRYEVFRLTSGDWVASFATQAEALGYREKVGIPQEVFTETELRAVEKRMREELGFCAVSTQVLNGLFPPLPVTPPTPPLRETLDATVTIREHAARMALTYRGGAAEVVAIVEEDNNTLRVAINPEAGTRLPTRVFVNGTEYNPF